MTQTGFKQSTLQLYVVTTVQLSPKEHMPRSRSEEKTEGVFTPYLFGSVKTYSGLFVQLGRSVWGCVKAVN